VRVESCLLTSASGASRGMEAVAWEDGDTGGDGRVEGREGVMLGWRRLLVTTALFELHDTDGGRGWAGGVQNGATPLFVACQNGQGEVVKLLLADGRPDVNQALTVRVGWEARAGGESGQAGRWVRCRAQCVSRRRATGAPISREASVRVESCLLASA
jgi:hypothetical protein